MDAARNSAQSSSRKTAAPAPGTKARVSSTHLDDAELRPSDSASNAPTRRSTSQSQKMTPPAIGSYGRRTARMDVVTKDSHRVKTRTTVNDLGANGPLYSQSAKTHAPQPSRHDEDANGSRKLKQPKKPQRELFPSTSPVCLLG